MKAITKTKISKAEAAFRFAGTKVTQDSHSPNLYEDIGANQYLVLTDIEAQELCEQYIRDSLWAFNMSFIAPRTKHGLSSKAQETLVKVQETLCEDANELIFALIDDIDGFIQDAIDADGRGHFLSSYDGEEIESDGYYIYKQ